MMFQDENHHPTRAFHDSEITFSPFSAHFRQQWLPTNQCSVAHRPMMFCKATDDWLNFEEASVALHRNIPDAATDAPKV